MPDQSRDPHDDKVRTVPLPTNDDHGGERVIAQENQSPEVAMGGGEWPSTDAPPTGPAPGTAGGTAPAPPADAGPSAGEGDGDDEFPPVRDVLEADPVPAGSRSTPVPDEDDQESGETKFS